MGIPTSAGLTGRIDGPPEARTTENGLAEARLPVRTNQWVEQSNGGQDVVTVRCVVVAYGDLAHRIEARFWTGDVILAVGRVRQASDGSEVFVANRVGHDVARMACTVRRDRSEARR